MLNKIFEDQEIKIFTDAVKNYFSVQTNNEAFIKTAFLSNAEIKTLDYTGIITLSGDYKGCVYFTAPRFMLVDLLTNMSETNVSEINLLDIVGEIANTISGNARKHFGKGLEISVPVKFSGKVQQLGHNIRQSPLTISILWKGFEAFVVVDIDKK